MLMPLNYNPGGNLRLSLPLSPSLSISLCLSLFLSLFLSLSLSFSLSLTLSHAHHMQLVIKRHIVTGSFFHSYSLNPHPALLDTSFHSLSLSFSIYLFSLPIFSLVSVFLFHTIIISSTAIMAAALAQPSAAWRQPVLGFRRCNLCVCMCVCVYMGVCLCVRACVCLRLFSL